MVYHENDIRAYYKCKKYFLSFNGIFEHSLQYKIFKKLLLKIFIFHLKNDSLKNIESYSYNILLDIINKLNQKENYLVPQINTLINKSTIILDNILHLLSLKNKIPIFGPLKLNYTFSNTTIKIISNCLYRTYTNTYISYYISPYNDIHSIKNDPIALLLYKIQNEFISKSLDSKNNFILRVIYFEKDNISFLDISSIKNETLSSINSLIFCLTEKINYPINPCRLNCKYKKECSYV